MHVGSPFSASLFVSAYAQNPPVSPDQSQEKIGYKSAADADKKTLLLKDFQPKSMLHVQNTTPQILCDQHSQSPE